MSIRTTPAFISRWPQTLMVLASCWVSLSVLAFDVPSTPPVQPAPAPAKTEPNAPTLTPAPTPAPAPAPATTTVQAQQALLIPPPLRLNYTIYGRVSHIPYRASGFLKWKHNGRTYESELEVSIFLLGSRVQTSQGRITAAGLQPLRFVDRVRNDRTVEFDYAQSLLRFSEGTAPTPLPAGAQDHLSIFIQMGAMVGAAPQRYPVGTVLNFEAMGIYGPEQSRLVAAGEERQALPGGELATFKFTRKAPRAEDPDAEIWLAPALGWLPARIRLSHANGDLVDQQWRGSEAP